MSARSPLAVLYPILNINDSDSVPFDRITTRALVLAENGIPLLQLRAKQTPSGVLARLTATLAAELANFGCRLIVNDRADIALAVNAGGVHLGQEDLPVSEARRLLGRQAIIGYSTHTLAEVRRAQKEDADYLGFGPVFESSTKTGIRRPRGLDLLARVCRVSRLPIVAIGGITLNRARLAWQAGAAAVASIAEIEHAADLPRLLCSYRRAAPGGGS